MCFYMRGSLAKKGKPEKGQNFKAYAVHHGVTRGGRGEGCCTETLNEQTCKEMTNGDDTS